MNNVFDSEFDWFAIDQKGYIGHFSSAGYGAIPTVIRKNVREQLDLNEYFMRMAETTTVTLVGGEGKRDDWINMACRGLYSYDFKHWDGPYVLIARPDKPTNIKNLPDHIRTKLQNLRFDSICFQDIDYIQPQDFVPC